MRISSSFVNLSRRAAVLSLLLFVAAVTYAQITPSDDAYVNSAAPATNYGDVVTLNLSSTGTPPSFVLTCPRCPPAIPALPSPRRR